MGQEQHEYRKIAKGTAIFGGVQIFNILIGIIKSKVVAIFLGAEGVGILGLFNSVVDLVRNVTGLGLNTSAVREISFHSENEIELKRVTSIVRKLCWLTGLLGMISMIILAPWLSQWTFNSSQYTAAFMILSIVPLLQSLSFGQLAVMQGLRKVGHLAKANLYGGVGGLIFLIPSYWWLGVDGVVPYLIISQIITLSCSYYFANKLKIKSIVLTFKQSCTMGMEMIKLGILLTLTAFLATFITYLLRVYITTEGGLVDVGLYTAASSIFMSYIGLVFTAMGTDFFPRLSAVRNDNAKISEMTNQQAEIGVLILTPMVVAFMLFAPLILTVLYSSDFVPASEMLRWAMLGVLLQTASWPLAYVILAKANNKVYLLKEIGSGTYLLCFSLLGYKYFGITGLGIGFVCTYVCGLIQNILLNKYLYKVTLNWQYYKILAPCLMMCGAMFVIILFLDNTIWLYVAGVLIFCGSAWYSFGQLNKKIGIKNIIVTRFKK